MHHGSTTSKQHLTEKSGFGANPGELRMMFYAPPDLAPGSPLVVILHGSTQNAAAYAEGTGWLSLAARFGFAVLCPEQTSDNNACLAFNWFKPSDISRDGGEAASIRQMVAFATNEYLIDPQRVFITGLSAGGAMTAVMLATYPDLFSGGAVIAGLPYGAAASLLEAWIAMHWSVGRDSREWGDRVRSASRNEGRWPSISVWHGTNDRTVRSSAGDDLVRQWTNVHGVEGEPADATTADGRAYHMWRSSDGVPVVEHHRIAGMDHGTPVMVSGPERCGRVGDYFLDVGVSSSMEIARAWGVTGATSGIT